MPRRIHCLFLVIFIIALQCPHCNAFKLLPIGSRRCSNVLTQPAKLSYSHQPALFGTLSEPDSTGWSSKNFIKAMKSKIVSQTTYLLSMQKMILAKLRALVAVFFMLAAQMKPFSSPLSASAALASITSLPGAALASPWGKYSNLRAYEKLSTTPVFFLGNSQGSPYLQDDVQTGRPDQRVITYFMSSDDASDFLNEMAQGNPQNVNEFRLMTTSLEKALGKIKAKKQSRKLGRYEMGTIYRIQPSMRQCDNAVKVLASSGKTSKSAERFAVLKDISIPMFSAKGLIMTRASGETLTPYYFAYEDLREDWDKLVQASSAAKGSSKEVVVAKASAGASSATAASVPSVPNIVVTDFATVMCLSQGLTKPDAPVVTGASAGVKRTTSSTEDKSVKDSTPAATTSVTKGQKQANEGDLKTLKNVGIVPPRREIEMLRKFYRNKTGYKNEFSESKIIG